MLHSSFDDGVKIHDTIVNNKRLRTMEIGRENISINNISLKDHHFVGGLMKGGARSPQCGYDSPTRGLEEVLSNGTVPQSTLSRPSFTGYSKQRKIHHPLASHNRQDGLDASSQRAGGSILPTNPGSTITESVKTSPQNQQQTQL